MKNGKSSFWLNGVKVVKFEMFTPEWNAMIADSKFKNWEGFGQSRKGRICLQDHSDTVWYRNIKIKRL
ncbi:family 16 glycoside hydrolase [Okeania hirsuta]|uniref:family 16 glycoside hydrolase n=1 Tax=Okeania hirsuta TaxID=1458930 RepID=UPI0035C8B9C8